MHNSSWFGCCCRLLSWIASNSFCVFVTFCVRQFFFTFYISLLYFYVDKKQTRPSISCFSWGTSLLATKNDLFFSFLLLLVIIKKYTEPEHFEINLTNNKKATKFARHKLYIYTEWCGTVRKRKQN